MVNRNRFVIVSLVTLTSLSGVATALAAWTQQGERRVSFKAVGPGGLVIEGKGTDITVSEQGNEISVSVGLNDIKTGIGLRDSHMRNKYLETAKFPRATFLVGKSKLKLPGAGEAQGNLNLHGVDKPVTVKYEAKGSDKAMHVTGSLQLNIKDFGIHIPTYLGVTVKPDVTVFLQFQAANK